MKTKRPSRASPVAVPVYARSEGTTVCLGLICLLSLLGGLAFSGRRTLAQASAPTAPEAAAIDRFMEEQIAIHRVPGLALAIIEGDTVRYVQGYGVARSGQPITPQTQFHIASLSKSITAAAVMQFAEAGKVELDAPVQRYLPEFTLADPAGASRITVRQLLNQTSGLADGSVPELRLPQAATSAERIATLANARLAAAPGTKFQYTDANYQVLARVVEVASGEPFSDYLQRHVFAPLGMTQTANAMTSFEVPQQATALAQGHLLAFGLPIPSGEERGYLGGGAGVISTAADMARYLVMQGNGGRFEGQQVLSPASITTMQTPPPNTESGYAMGWIAHTINGRRVLEHNGILSTFYSEMVLLPETGRGFVLLANVHSLAQDALGFPRIKAGLIALLTGAPPPSGGFGVSSFEALFGLLTAATVALGARGLLRLPHWRQTAGSKPWWRHLLGLIGAFAPVALALAMPQIVLSSSGRAFGYVTLFRSMIEVMSWLTLWALFGVLNGGIRLGWLLLHRRRSKRRADL